MLGPVKRAIRSALRTRGHDIVAFPFGIMSRGQIIEHGDIDLVLDVGANTGQFGRHVRAEGYGGRIISFEPQSRPFDQLVTRASNDPLWQCHRLALGDQESEEVIHVAANEGLSSSLLGMLEAHVNAAPRASYIDEERVTVVRLDQLKPDLIEPTDRIYLKVDTQGYELRVLEGAGDTLDQVRVIECELSLTSLYAGQPLIGDVFRWLHRRGFVPLQIEPDFADEQTGELLQANGIFVRHVMVG